MSGRFELKSFANINLSDVFFDELKADYPGSLHSTGFEEWFHRKADDGATALVFEDEVGVGAFVYLKQEQEPIHLSDRVLAEKSRIKIGTLRIAERFRGQRLGEGAVALALWHWQHKRCEEIYVTVFEKQEPLIALLERFGFTVVGKNPNGELVLLRSRQAIDHSDPYSAFPFVDPKFEHAGYLIVDDRYHDTLFPYSELAHTQQESLAVSASNGVSKTYIGNPYHIPPYKRGEPLLIYRKHTGQGSKGHRSCVTSFAVVIDVVVIKKSGRMLVSFDDAAARIGNKSVFDNTEIKNRIERNQNAIAVELLYCGFLGSGNNVNWTWLNNNGLWPKTYPTNARLTHDQFERVLSEGRIDVSNVIVN